MNLTKEGRKAYNKLLKKAEITEDDIETLKYYERVLAEQE